MLGVDPSAERAEPARLAPGSTVLLYTDGLVERRGSTLDEGTARLVEQVRELAGLPLRGSATPSWSGCSGHTRGRRRAGRRPSGTRHRRPATGRARAAAGRRSPLWAGTRGRGWAAATLGTRLAENRLMEERAWVDCRGRCARCPTAGARSGAGTSPRVAELPAARAPCAAARGRRRARGAGHVGRAARARLRRARVQRAPARGVAGGRDRRRRQRRLAARRQRPGARNHAGAGGRPRPGPGWPRAAHGGPAGGRPRLVRRRRVQARLGLPAHRDRRPPSPPWPTGPA